MVRTSEDFLGPITILNSDGYSPTVTATNARLIDLEDPIDPQDAATRNYVDGYIGAWMDITNEPTGFENRVDSVISINDGTRTFSIQPAVSSYRILLQGRLFVKDALETVVWDDVEGIHYFYFDAEGALTHTTNVDDFILIIKGAGATVSIIYWDATNSQTIYFGEERHGAVMDGATHAHLHLCYGAQWIDGGAPGSMSVDGTGNDNADAQFSVGNVDVEDEDIYLSFTDGTPQDLSPIAQIPVFYRDGASGYWRKKSADNYPIIYSGTVGYVGANGRLPYNQWTGATWTLTEIGNTNFVLTHYFVTTDVNEPVIGIHGQNTYSTKNAAQTGATTEINELQGTTDLLDPEHAPLFTVIWQTATGYGNAVKGRIVSTDDGGDYIDFRGHAYRGVGGVSGITVHSGLSGLLNDDHTQYLLIDGTRAMSGSLDMDGNSIINVNQIQAEDGENLIISTSSSGNIILNADGYTSIESENVALHAAPTSWQNGENIVFIGQCTTEPDNNPESGGYLFVNSTGDLCYHGPNGTVTTIAPA